MSVIYSTLKRLIYYTCYLSFFFTQSDDQFPLLKFQFVLFPSRFSLMSSRQDQELATPSSKPSTYLLLEHLNTIAQAMLFVSPYWRKNLEERENDPPSLSLRPCTLHTLHNHTLYNKVLQKCQLHELNLNHTFAIKLSTVLKEKHTTLNKN